MSEYRIDDLARAAGTTTRNVRSYQERGLLPVPTTRSGRALIYDDSHLERLKLIDALLQRGFTTAHISDFITSWETGKDLIDVLGLPRSATTDRETASLEVPLELVESFLGAEAIDPAMLARLSELGLLRVRGDTVEFTDPQLLETFADLHGYRFDLRRLADLQAVVKHHLDDIAHQMFTVTRDHLVELHGEGWLPTTDAEIAETTTMINHLRDVAVAAVQHTLVQALDRALTQDLSEYLAETSEAHSSARRGKATPDETSHQ
ncbi:MerR family transcriptional regulator [Nocardia mangyaensis]|uniref:MerR family transcriptional regulator n=1 Tax=Nocardia mangyaensis TaxID=2213200 RepID=UPI0026756B63|nr:MerR family transcriptional regulator [Nocardia mangyaensis]MDO3646279.1 MerR family transcriptional regulator [Nocardia mangyaensis]